MDRRHDRPGDPPEVKPVDVDGVRTVAIITVLWALAFVVLAFRRSELDDAGRGWWIWACLAGVGLGLLGLEYCRKRRDAIARAELDAEADAGFDDAGDWADGELAALAVEEDSPDIGFEQPTQEYSPYDRTPPAAPLPFDPPTPPPPSMPPPSMPPPAQTAGHDTGEHTRTYSPSGRPPPGYVTGDFPAVSEDLPPVTRDVRRVPNEAPRQRPMPEAPRLDAPPSENWPEQVPPPAAAEPITALPGVNQGPPPRPARPASPERAYPDPAYPDAAAPAGYSPDPDRSRRHPRDEEIARRYREEQARAAAAGYDPPSYPQFLEHEAARHDEAFRQHETPPRGVPPVVDQPPPPSPTGPAPSRQTPGFDSEFFTDEPTPETGHGADFLLDDDEPDEGYRGRRARRE